MALETESYTQAKVIVNIENDYADKKKKKYSSRISSRKADENREFRQG